LHLLLQTFFESKVNTIHAATGGSPAPSFVDARVKSPLRQFEVLSSDDVVKLVHSAPAKQSDLDPLPTWLLKDCIDLLRPYVTRDHQFNTLLSTGCVPDAFKVACITPLLKKPDLDANAPENYRPVSNLSVMSKTLERALV